MDKAQILLEIDSATAPYLMSKQQALEWIETLIDDLKMRCEALRDEMKA